MDSVAPFICGAAVAEGPVAPGGTWRGTLMVDDSVCPDPVYSVVTMLGEKMCSSSLVGPSGVFVVVGVATGSNW